MRDPRSLGKGMRWSDVPHPWICPQPACRRVIQLRYNPRRPLPTCVGNPVHPPTMLVSSNEDEYRDCFDRFGRGERFLKPIINNRNAHLFQKHEGPYMLRDIATPAVRG